MSGPRITSGKGESKQDYATPKDFIDAVEKRFGKIRFDLAAHAGNAKAPFWFGPDAPPWPEPLSLPRNGYNTLEQDWTKLPGDPDELLWLNPPFDNIKPFVEKCADTMTELRERRRRVTRADHAAIALLVPASVGSNWFADYVFPCADVHFLNGRLCFDGEHNYPKDCQLAIYDSDDVAAGSFEREIWSWAGRSARRPA